ncbi:HET-domain-containing protein [Byssothecium circinans]|uniref:HET-domain-containing protein n=1 Tax=Byssothecium circinans TaxID=147558 RepID=A0A6A5TBT1_9PLEO|nr:HET-domain-containing protein [Byssothecium circinans]
MLWTKYRCGNLTLRRGKFTPSSKEGYRDSVTFLPEHEDSDIQIFDAESPDYGRVNRWLSFCRENHTGVCGKLPERKISGLRVIDCKTRTMAALPLNCPYITLSYVWGSEREAEQHLRFDAPQLPSQLPKTIEDAMEICLRIDVPFLWVDRYCINQADAAEKQHLISNMDIIYRNAEVTIIAAAGKDPSEGLPGVRGTPRSLPKTIKIGPDTFVELRKNWTGRECEWNSRGWTYQEGLFSRRRLVFMESQIAFQCMQHFFFESLKDGISPGHYQRTRDFVGEALFPLRTQMHTRRSVVDALHKDLTQYYTRKFTFSGDILNGFQGISNYYREMEVLSENKFKHFWGITYPLCIWFDTFIFLCG